MARNTLFKALHEMTIFILGCTGTGKSKLAIDLAKKLNGEIINADAMQLYAGLDIITNKVTPEEQKQVPHHLLSTLDFKSGADFTVHSFRTHARATISDIRAREHVPIVVGGTNYYIEALLYDDFLNRPTDKKDELVPSDDDDAGLHEKLAKLKPELASKFHPNELRKIRSALKHFKDSGKSSRPISLAYTNHVVFWLDYDQEPEFEKFLDLRIDKMCEKGLISELDHFLAQAVGLDLSPDAAAELLLHKDECNEEQRRGILQSIGFKEFRNYLKLEPEQRLAQSGRECLAKCMEDMKSSTHRYAKRQRRWIRSRFLNRPVEGSLAIYRLNISPMLIIEAGHVDEAKWQEEIVIKAMRIVNNESADDSLPRPEQIRDPTSSGQLQDLTTGPPYSCPVCAGRLFYDLHSFQCHVQSRSHARRISKAKKRKFAVDEEK